MKEGRTQNANELTVRTAEQARRDTQKATWQKEFSSNRGRGRGN